MNGTQDNEANGCKGGDSGVEVDDGSTIKDVSSVSRLGAKRRHGNNIKNSLSD